MLAVDRDPLHKEIASLRALLDERDEEIRQLKSRMSTPYSPWLPRSWRLAPQEIRLVLALYAANGRIVEYDQLFEALRSNAASMSQIIGIRICTCRQKLKTRGITIESHFSFGYSMPKESCAIVAAALEA